MKRLLSHLVTRVKESWNRPTSRRPHVTQLKLEQLEDRLVPSTTEYVNPAALINFNNVYGDFRSAYNAAQPGDTIQLKLGATIPGGTINKQLTIQGDPSYSANNYTVTGNVQHGSNSRLVADVQQLQKHDHTGMQAITSAGSTVRADAASAAAMDSFNGAFTPQEMQHAYGFDNIAFGNGTIAADGSGQTIAIVDLGDDPNITSDLHNFDVAYGLPDPPNFSVSQQFFGQPVFSDPSGGWELEEALDVEWAHAMAPGANIILVETSNLFGGVQAAANLPGVSVVSMSWSVDGPGISANDSLFTTPAGHAGVTFVGVAGDGGTFSYPGSSPNVLAVGGTTLSLDASGNYGGETVWNDGNGGLSSGGGQDPNYPVKPGPDVAYNAGTPVWVYDSFNNSQNPWLTVVGTSAGAPQWGALIAIADQGLALNGVGSLDGATQTIPMLNHLAGSAFHTDIPGSNGNGFSGPAVVGLGTPYANLVIGGLVQQGTPPSTTEYVVPGVYNGNTYGDFWSAYNAAQPGDTIQLERGATIPGGTINKQLTIQGDLGYSANNYTVTGDIEVAPGGSGTTFNNLDFSQSTLTIDPNANGVTVENSLVGQLNSYGSNTLIVGNTIQGRLNFSNGGSNNVSWNTFVGSYTYLVMADGVNDAVNDNTFQVSSPFAIDLLDEQGAMVADNQIYNTGVPDPYGIQVINDGYSQGTFVQIESNVIQTGDQGVGFFTENLTESTFMHVSASGNNFGGNAVGVLIDGDGQSPGLINLGGAYGNPGGNDFSDYQGGDGRLAIAVVNTADNIIWAQNNTWGTYPGNVVKDSMNNTYQQTTPDYTANQTGTGTIFF